MCRMSSSLSRPRPKPLMHFKYEKEIVDERIRVLRAELEQYEEIYSILQTQNDEEM